MPLPTLLACFALLLFVGLLLISTRKAWFAMLLMVPWSLAWPSAEGAGLPLGGLVVELPIEPAMVLLCLALLVRQRTRRGLRGLLLKALSPEGQGRLRWCNPLTLSVGLIGVHLAWLILAMAVSVAPGSGIKELIVRCVVLMSFFLAPLVLFGEASTSDGDHSDGAGDTSEPGAAGLVIARACPRFQQLLDRGPWLLAAGLIPMVVLSAINQVSAGPYLAGDPWYRGHIEYGQSLAVVSVLLLPLVIFRTHLGRIQVWLARLMVGGLWAGILIGRSRSAVLLILVALPVFVMIKRGARARSVLSVSLAAFVLGCLAFSWVLQVRSQVLLVSSAERPTAPLGAMVESVLAERLFTDESLTERYNRWDTAITMAWQRPWFGFGPGAFEGLYAGFQKPGLMTRFSTEEGDLGDVHSHYLEFLAEQGVPGFAISVLLFAIPLCCSGLRLDESTSDDEVAWHAAVAAAWCGLMVSSVFSTFLTLQETAPLYFLLLTFAVGGGHRKGSCLSA